MAVFQPLRCAELDVEIPFDFPFEQPDGAPSQEVPARLVAVATELAVLRVTATSVDAPLQEERLSEAAFQGGAAALADAALLTAGDPWFVETQAVCCRCTMLPASTDAACLYRCCLSLQMLPVSTHAACLYRCCLSLQMLAIACLCSCLPLQMRPASADASDCRPCLCDGSACRPCVQAPNSLHCNCKSHGKCVVCCRGTATATRCRCPLRQRRGPQRTAALAPLSLPAPEARYRTASRT